MADNKVALKDMEADEYYSPWPDSQVDKRLKPILDQVFGPDMSKEQALQEKIKASINKVDTVEINGQKEEVRHGLKIIAVPETVGNSFVTSNRPGHEGQQTLYFHVNEQNVTKGIVYPRDEENSIPPAVFMKHELGHVAQNRGGYKTPLSALDDKPIGSDKNSREQDAYKLEITSGKYRKEYGDGVTKIEVNGEMKAVTGVRMNENPTLNSNLWDRKFAWPSQERHSEADHMQGLAAVSKQINAADNGFTEQQKAALNLMVAKNAEAAGITIQDTQKREIQQDAGRSLGMG